MQTKASWRVHANYRYICNHMRSQKLITIFSFRLNTWLICKESCSIRPECVDIRIKVLCKVPSDILMSVYSVFSIDVLQDIIIQRCNARDLFCLFVGCLTSKLHTSVSQRLICSDMPTCCHIEIEVAYQTFYLIHSQ